MTYTFTIVLLFALGAIVIQFEQDQCGFVTAATELARTLCTVGPGLN